MLDKSLACAGDGPTVYEGARDELKYYFGEAFVAELDALKSKQKLSSPASALFAREGRGPR